MTTKLTDTIKAEARNEYVHGFHDENGVRQFPSVDFLSKRHGVSRPTLYRAAKKDEWQKQKNRYQTKLQDTHDRERLEQMLDSGKRLDDNALNIAQAMLSRIGRRLQAAMQRERDNPEDAGMDASELRELSVVAANAQKVGKLALGQAQEISKVSADVTNPEAFRAVMAQLDELAEARACQDNEPVH